MRPCKLMPLSCEHCLAEKESVSVQLSYLMAPYSNAGRIILRYIDSMCCLVTYHRNLYSIPNLRLADNKQHLTCLLHCISSDNSKPRCLCSLVYWLIKIQVKQAFA